MRTDLDRSAAMDYWRGPHSQLVARTPGFREYRQHHFPADPTGLWPVTEGVETDIPERRRIDGTPEVLLDGAIGSLRALIPNKKVHNDEANIFGRTVLYNTKLGAGREFDTANGPISRTRARTVVLFRRRPSADTGAVAALLHELGPLLANLDDVTEVRVQPFAPFRENSWNTPGVAHDNEPADQFHGCLILGAIDDDALGRALGSPELARMADPVGRACLAVHAYPVDATYVYTRDGRPTLPQHKSERKPPLAPARRKLTTPTPPRGDELPPASLIVLPSGGDGPAPGPEDIVCASDGYLYCGIGTGAVVQVDPRATNGAAATSIVAHTGGRPLGLEPLADGRLLVCDARRGLLRVDPETGTVETLVEYVDGVPLRFCSNAAATPDGAIWFTESTTRFDFEHYMGSFLEHRGSGRLLRLDPGGTVDVVADGLGFPNGLSVTPDGEHLVMAETSGYRLSVVDALGPDLGRRRDLCTDLPGFADNISTFRDSRAWLAMTGPRSAALDRLGTTPRLLRRAIWRFGNPGPGPHVWARAIDPEGTALTDIRGNVAGFHHATGIAEAADALFFAGPDQSRLVRIDLTEVCR